MHTIAILALDGVVAFDMAIPIEVFGRARLADGRPAYQVRLCTLGEKVQAGLFVLHSPDRVAALAEAETIIVPGVSVIPPPMPLAVLDALQGAATRGARIASICTGAFILAATGLLDGLVATTHWAAAPELAQRYPQIRVDPNVLFMDNGQFLTSAGAAAGLDLCLHLVRRDYGSAVAAEAARLSVMPLERDGGQAQFIDHAPPTSAGAALEPLLRWMEAQMAQPLTLAQLAEHARLSLRTLNRRFREQTGTTPLHWLHLARLRQAQVLLETTDHPIEQIARLVGFGAPATFRDRFHAVIGTSPQSYRRAFRRKVVRP